MPLYLTFAFPRRNGDHINGQNQKNKFQEHLVLIFDFLNLVSILFLLRGLDFFFYLFIFAEVGFNLYSLMRIKRRPKDINIDRRFEIHRKQFEYAVKILRKKKRIIEK